MDGIKDTINRAALRASLGIPPARYFKERGKFFVEDCGFVSEVTREDFLAHVRRVSAIITYWRSHPGDKVAA